MRLTIPISLMLLALLVFSSCKKEPIEPCEPVIYENHSNDTILPSDYIMAYPGSWWEYSDGFIDSCASWQAVPIQTSNISDGCITVQQDQKILPTGLFYAENLAGHQRVYTDGEYSSSILTPLIDTIVGVFYNEVFSGGYGLYTYTDTRTVELLERLDSMVIGMNTYYDVLHVKQVSDLYYWKVSSGPIFTQFYWFAKDVGLIKWIREENGTVYEDIELVNHYIAPY